MKVLVVDDSGVMRKIIIRGLNACGMSDIVEGGNGREAWEAFQSDSFDLVITDWNMPEMNGLDLLRSIRESGSTVPVIMVTTENEREKVVQAIQYGVSDYLCKPFDQESLRRSLDKFAVA